MKALSFKRFVLNDNIDLVTETSLFLVARVEVCSLFCMNTSSKAWTWDPAQRICHCVLVPEKYHCKNYFVQPMDLKVVANEKTIYVKTSVLPLREDCTGCKAKTVET